MQRKQISSIVFLTILLSLVSIIFFPLVGFITLVKGLTIISIFFVFLGLMKKEVGLLGIGMIAILDPFSRVFLATGGNILFRWNTNNYILLFSAVVLIFQRVKIKDAASKFLFLLILICVIQLTYSTDLLSGSSYILNLLSYFGFLAFFIFISSENPSIFANSFLVIAIFGLIINTLYQFAADELPSIDHSSIAQSGLSVLYTICLGLSFDNKSSNFPSQWVIITSSIMVFLIFITGSRSSATLAIMAYIYILARVGNFSASNRVFVVLSGAMILFALFNQFSGLTDTAQYRFVKLLNENVSLTEKTSNRSDLLLIGWNIFVDNPLGVGTGSLADKQIIQSYAYDYSQNPYLYSSGVNTVHSALMKTLAENGLLGGMLLLLFTFSFTYSYIRNKNRRIGMEIGLLYSVVLLFSLFVTEFQSKSLVYFASGVAYILYYRTKFEYMSFRQRRNVNAIKPYQYRNIKREKWSN